MLMKDAKNDHTINLKSTLRLNLRSLTGSITMDGFRTTSSTDSTTAVVAGCLSFFSMLCENELKEAQPSFSSVPLNEGGEESLCGTKYTEKGTSHLLQNYPFFPPLQQHDDADDDDDPPRNCNRCMHEWHFSIQKKKA